MTADSDIDPPWDVERLQGLARSYQLPLVLLAVLRSGAFERLAAGPATAAELANACAVDAGALSRLLDALVSVGIMERHDQRYRLPDSLADGLSSTGIGSPLDGLKHAAESLDKWSQISEALARGHAEYTDRLDVTVDAQRNETFIRAMQAYAGPMAQRFAGLLERRGAERFLDLGGGPGTFSLALLDAWPDLRATIADLPLTLRITRQVIAEAGVQDRCTLLEADFYKDRACVLGGPYDLVLISAVIHAEGEEENRDLFRRVREKVSPGGRIVVRERLLDEDRRGPPRSNLFDVHMLVSTRRGRCYSLSEISSMLTDAGFVRPRLLSSPDDGFVVADA